MWFYASGNPKHVDSSKSQFFKNFATKQYFMSQTWVRKRKLLNEFSEIKRDYDFWANKFGMNGEFFLKYNLDLVSLQYVKNILRKLKSWFFFIIDCCHSLIIKTHKRISMHYYQWKKHFKNTF